MPNSNDAAPALLSAPPRRKRFWVDMGMFQLSIVWLADWTPRSLPLILMAMVSAGVYALWAWRGSEDSYSRAARLLLAASVAVPLGFFLLAPSTRPGAEFLQIVLLIAAGFTSVRIGRRATVRRAATN